MESPRSLFVIARDAGKYRCLAGVNHPDLRGASVLQRCRDLLKMFSNPNNHIAIREEIRRVENHDDVDKAFYSGVAPIGIPFPFVMTCLVVGSSFNLEEGYFFPVRPDSSPMPLRPRMKDEGRLLAKLLGPTLTNIIVSSGMTVIDISDLEKIRYCLVDFPRGIHVLMVCFPPNPIIGFRNPSHQMQGVPPMTSLDGHTHVESRFWAEILEPGPEAYIAASQLDKWSIISWQVLRDTWPKLAQQVRFTCKAD